MIRLTLTTCLALAASLGASAQTPAPAAPGAAATGAAALPPGPGKAIAVKTCQSCHGLEVVTAKRASPEDWASTVQLMVSRGADATDEEVDTLTKYLAASFPAVKDSKAAPTTAPAAPSSEAPPASHLDGVESRFLTPLITPAQAKANR